MFEPLYISLPLLIESFIFLILLTSSYFMSPGTGLPNTKRAQQAYNRMHNLDQHLEGFICMTHKRENLRNVLFDSE